MDLPNKTHTQTNRFAHMKGPVNWFLHEIQENMEIRCLRTQPISPFFLANSKTSGIFSKIFP